MADTYDKSIIELTLVMITGMIFIIMSHFNINRISFILPTCLFWIKYLYEYSSYIINIRTDNIIEASQIPILVFVTSIIGMGCLVKYFKLKYKMNSNLIILCIVYPFWGIMQQILVQNILTQNVYNICEYYGLVDNTLWLVTVAITSVLFGLLHIGDKLLCLGTFGLALIWTPHYLTYYNVLPLGIFHGWIGAFFYFLILNKDPLKTLV